MRRGDGDNGGDPLWPGVAQGRVRYERFWALLATAGGEAVWGSASGVLAITRGSESKMSAAGAQSDSTRHPKYNFRLPASFGNCVLIRARWFARSSGSTIAVAAWPSIVAPETPPTPISYRLARPSRSGSYSAVMTRPGGACIPPSRALPVPATSPVTVLRCPEHVPSPSRRLPKAAGKSNFSRSMAVLSRTNTSCRYDVSCVNLSKRGRPDQRCSPLGSVQGTLKSRQDGPKEAPPMARRRLGFAWVVV